MTPITLGQAIDRIDAGPFTIARSTYRAGQVLPAHTHANACATIVLDGSVTELIAGRRLECSRDQFLVRPADMVHENAYGPRGAECMIVSASADWVARDRVARRVFAAPRVSRATVPLLVARGIRRELDMSDDASALAIEGLALELIATSARDIVGHDRRIAPRWLKTVRARLHDQFAAPVRLASLAADAGVHPVHLARAFRQCFGCSPGEYIRQRRLDHAAAELSRSDRSVAQIALDAGFSSPSHFATAFRRATGMSPRAYRASGLHPRPLRRS